MHMALPLIAAAGLAADLRMVGETAAGGTFELPPVLLPFSDLAEHDLVVLSLEGPSAPPETEGEAMGSLVLAGGERLRGRVAGGSGEILSLRLIGDVVLPLDVSNLRSLVFADRIPENRTEPVAAPAELDRLYHRVGASLDPIDGTLEGFSAEGVRFESHRVGSRLYAWDQVAALFVEVLEQLGSPQDVGGSAVVVDLLDGSRLRGRMQVLSSTGLNLVIGRDTEISLPLETLAEIARDDGSVTFLSELAARGETGLGNPFDSEGEVFGMVWPFRADRAVTGGALRAGGRTWRRGVGAHAPSRITWALDGAWRELRGAVAVDDSVLRGPAQGSVVFRLHLDGELVWESPVMSSGDPAVHFPALALEAKTELVLEADMADGLNQGDRANWLRMMLLR